MIRYVQLTPGNIDLARTVGIARHRSGPARTLVSEGNMAHTDIVAAMGEIAVCLHYGEEPTRWVEAYEKRPAATPDLIHGRYTVSVKSTEHWGDGIRLIVPSYDTDNDIYILTSINAEKGIVGLRGWLPLRELLAYAPENWKSLGRGSGQGKRYRYIPVTSLRECRRNDGQV